MNQPQNPGPSRSARPQLFSAPAGAQPNANAKRHADFGPSILATIDGGQARYANKKKRNPAVRVLLLGVLALAAAAAYVGVKFAASRAGAAPEIVAVRAQAVIASTEPLPVSRPVEAPLAAASQAELAAREVATIEMVTPAPAPASAAASSGQATSVATSLNSIQLALDGSEPAKAEPPKRKVASKTALKTRRPESKVAKAKSQPVTAASARSPDEDAALLAAMLPHIKGSIAAPTSPAYEKRCGQLTGSAEVDCRARFCNGREGDDAACPANGAGK